MKQDSSQHGLRITENMVEQVAVASYEDTRQKNQHVVLPSGARMPSWAGLSPMVKYETRASVLAALKLVIPVLLEEGWTPPVAGDAA
ncbi:hypothetical protein [Glutamicibacter ardleyensis]|uniref:hypothetical protein n=1 Tax=Glutamicibacter ardleyensis TaxID=225894 RepID=UPI003FD15716